jgi:predicted NBD/HSP70 family sugar kinase
VLIGVDAGATTMSVGLVTETGEFASALRVPTIGLGPGTTVRPAGRDRILIGLPGLVDVECGMMVSRRPVDA